MLSRVAIVAALLSFVPLAADAKPSKRKSAPADEAAQAEAEVGSAWYAAVNGKTEGPFDDAAFVLAYLSGRVTDDTLVWWDGAERWVALSKASWFVELDRWYVRHGAKGFGPVTGTALRAKLAKGRTEGHDVTKLEVRLEWSGWVPLASAAPLREGGTTGAPMTWEPTPSPPVDAAAKAIEPFDAPASASAPSGVAPSGPTPPAIPTDPIASPEPTPTPALVPVAVERERPRPASAPREDVSADVARIKRLRTAGIITLGVGGGLVVIAGGIAGGYNNGTVGAAGLGTAIGLCGAAVPPMIVGGAMLGAARVKQRRLNERLAAVRVAPALARGHAGVVVGGRF